MKKSILGIVLLVTLTLVLSACGKTSEDKMQGKWKADNSVAQYTFGDSMTIKDNNIKVAGSEDTEIKYFNFKDSNDKDSKQIRLYAETPKSNVYDKDNPIEEGILKFKDDKTITIDIGMGAVCKFTKE